MRPRGLRASGHGSDQVLVGETAAATDSPGPVALMSATRFTSDLLPAAGWSHHPYTLTGTVQLRALLDRAAARGALRARLPIYFTEAGYQTDPPDSLFGVPLADQASYLNESDWLAFGDPRVRGVAQYLLVDEPRLSALQSGLRFADDRAKPSCDAYRMPVWLQREARGALLWGRVRPASAIAAAQTVEIQHRAGARRESPSAAASTATTNASPPLPKRWSSGP